VTGNSCRHTGGYHTRLRTSGNVSSSLSTGICAWHGDLLMGLVQFMLGLRRKLTIITPRWSKPDILCMSRVQKIPFQALKEAVGVNKASLGCMSYKNLLLVKDGKHGWEIRPLLFCLTGPLRIIVEHQKNKVIILWSIITEPLKKTFRRNIRDFCCGCWKIRSNYYTISFRIPEEQGLGQKPRIT
jgi:hypothetical protein